MVTQTHKDGYIQLKDGKLFYEQAGSGFPLLLVHGSGWTGVFWRRILDPLAQHFTVYVPDMPGFDRSDRPSHPYTMQEFADAVLEFMDKMGVEKAHIIGNLTGSLVSLEIATSHAERVEKLILSSCPGWTAEEGKIIYERYFVPRDKEERERGSDMTLEQAKQRFGRLADQEFVDLYVPRRKKDFEWSFEVHKANTFYDAPSRLHKVKAPTLLIYGENDVLRRREQVMHDGIKGSVLRVIPESSTAVYFLQPQAFLKEVLPFLTGTPSAAA